VDADHLGMKRILPIVSLAVLLAFASAASAAPVAFSGSFHLAGNAVGCHYVVYGPVHVDIGTSAKIRCERSSDHTIVTLSTTGKATEAHKGKPVPKGTRTQGTGWTPRYAPKTDCVIGGYRNAPAITCSDGNKGSFMIGAGIVKVTR
jgi:hypothetical protein